jgi:hypothetical protein
MQTNEKMRECMKCKKMKPEKDGYVKLAGLYFCCKNCCDGEAKGDKAGKKPNVCEFC